MKSLIKELFGDLTAWGRVWLYSGLAALACSLCMCIDYGLSVTLFHAGTLAVLTIFTALLPHTAHRLFTTNKWVMGGIASVLCLYLLNVEFGTHMAYTAGIRGVNMGEAALQNARYDGAQDSAKEDKSNLEMWKHQLATLLEANAWAASVKADALRDQVTVAQKEIDLETARGGCKAKCALRMKDKADLEERIGKVEQAQSLNKQIEATQRILDKKRDVAATTDKKFSTVDLQKKAYVSTIALFGYNSLKVSDVTDAKVDAGVNLAMASLGTILPGLGLLMAGLYRRKDDEEHFIAPLKPIASSSKTITNVRNVFLDPFAGRVVAMNGMAT